MALEQETNNEDDLGQIIRSMIKTTIGHADAGLIKKEDEVAYLEAIIRGTSIFIKKELINYVIRGIDNLLDNVDDEPRQYNDFDMGVRAGKIGMGEMIKDYLRKL